MNVIEFLNNEFRNIVKEYNNSHECSYCVPNDLQGKKRDSWLYNFRSGRAGRILGII